MIAGPVLGGSWLGAYYGVGAAVEEPEPTPVATRAGGPSFPGWSTPRYRGQRQRVVDGKFLDDDAVIEEVGTPPPRELPFDPPTPWTPEPKPEAPERKTEPAQGIVGLGLTVPKPKPRTPTPTRRARKATITDPDEEALIVLLAALGYTWR